MKQDTVIRTLIRSIIQVLELVSLGCFVWAGAECQEHSSEYSGEEWAAGHENELGCCGQAGREPDQCCAKR
jgi:hypothetical protein